MIDIPDAVRRTTQAAGAGDWLDRLPDLVTELVREWSLALGPVHLAGTAALVLDAVTTDAVATDDSTTDDGRRPVVLKLPVPRGDLADREITVLTLADGHGCVPCCAAARRL